MHRTEKIDLLRNLQKGAVGIAEAKRRRMSPVLIEESENAFRCTETDEIFTKAEVEAETGRTIFILPPNNRDK